MKQSRPVTKISKLYTPQSRIKTAKSYVASTNLNQPKDFVEKNKEKQICVKETILEVKPIAYQPEPSEIELTPQSQQVVDFNDGPKQSFAEKSLIDSPLQSKAESKQSLTQFYIQNSSKLHLLNSSRHSSKERANKQVADLDSSDKEEGEVIEIMYLPNQQIGKKKLSFESPTYHYSPTRLGSVKHKVPSHQIPPSRSGKKSSESPLKQAWQLSEHAQIRLIEIQQKEEELRQIMEEIASNRMKRQQWAVDHPLRAVEYNSPNKDDILDTTHQQKRTEIVKFEAKEISNTVSVATLPVPPSQQVVLLQPTASPKKSFFKQTTQEQNQSIIQEEPLQIKPKMAPLPIKVSSDAIELTQQPCSTTSQNQRLLNDLYRPILNKPESKSPSRSALKLIKTDSPSRNSLKKSVRISSGKKLQEPAILSSLFKNQLYSPEFKNKTINFSAQRQSISASQEKQKSQSVLSVEAKRTLLKPQQYNKQTLVLGDTPSNTKSVGSMPKNLPTEKKRTTTNFGKQTLSSKSKIKLSPEKLFNPVLPAKELRTPDMKSLKQSSPAFGQTSKTPTSLLTQQVESKRNPEGLSNMTSKIESELNQMKVELDFQRRQTATEDFYDKLHELTYGDYQKHDSPTSRLVAQKQEQIAHKKIMNSINSATVKSQKQLFYTCGLKNSYLVQPKEIINYEEAKSKPLEYMKKFEEQELVKRRVKTGKSVGVYTYSERVQQRKIDPERVKVGSSKTSVVKK